MMSDIKSTLPMYCSFSASKGTGWKISLAHSVTNWISNSQHTCRHIRTTSSEILYTGHHQHKVTITQKLAICSIHTRDLSVLTTWLKSLKSTLIITVKKIIFLHSNITCQNVHKRGSCPYSNISPHLLHSSEQTGGHTKARHPVKHCIHSWHVSSLSP